MKSRLKGAVFSLACWGMLFPTTSLVAADKTPQTKQVKLHDVALHKGGTVVGRVVDKQGKPIYGAPVAVRHKGRNIAVVKTDKQGRYAVKGLRGGVHQLVAVNNTQTLRLWTAKSAPPKSQKSTLMVAKGPVVRGQDGCYVDATGQTAYAPGGAAMAAGNGVGGGFGAIDIITLATVGTAAGALVYAIDNNDTLDDIQSQLDSLPQSP